MASRFAGSVDARLLRSAMARAVEGVMPKVALAIGLAEAIGLLVLALASARRGGEVAQVGPLAAGLLAWGAGVLLCFAASMRAFDRDRTDGWDALLARHGARASTYLAARIVGLVLVTLVVVALGTLASGVAAALACHDVHSALDALDGTVAGVAYAIAFSIVVAPLAFATLGARNRASGYVLLLVVLVAPALVAEWTGQLVPDSWSELVSIPGALDALRESLLGSVDFARAVRATAVIVAAAALASLWARAQLEVHRS